MNNKQNPKHEKSEVVKECCRHLILDIGYYLFFGV